MRNPSTNPRGRKSYNQILERLGRLKERCANVSHFYNVNVERDETTENAASIQWRLEREAELESHFSGSYYIRSDRTDLTDEELWKLYVMLTRVESAFRCLKSELGLRPNFHRKDSRMEGHLFITVLSVSPPGLHSVESPPKGNPPQLADHAGKTCPASAGVTTSVTTKDGRRIHIRQNRT